MILKEEKRDLFTLPRDRYALAHCISANAKMGAGIAVRFANEFPSLRSNVLSQTGGRMFPLTVYHPVVGEMPVYNLVTKELHYHKPTYDSLRLALRDLHRHLTHDIVNRGVQAIGMPRIGCGLDRLKWDRVGGIIKQELGDLDIEVLVCTL